MIFPYKLPYFIKMMRVLGSGSYGLSYGWKVLKVSLESKLGLYICNKGLSIKWFLNCVFSGGIYQIKLETIIWRSEQFSSELLVHVHYLFSINFSYVWVIYFFPTITYAHHVGFQQRVPGPEFSVICSKFISLWISELVVQLRPRYQVLVPYLS